MNAPYASIQPEHVTLSYETKGKLYQVRALRDGQVMYGINGSLVESLPNTSGTEESPWLVKIYEQGNGDEYLFDDVGLLATTRSLGKLHYRRFWHIDAELGAEPCFACFTGFAEYH